MYDTATTHTTGGIAALLLKRDHEHREVKVFAPIEHHEKRWDRSGDSPVRTDRHYTERVPPVEIVVRLRTVQSAGGATVTRLRGDGGVQKRTRAKTFLYGRF